MHKTCKTHCGVLALLLSWSMFLLGENRSEKTSLLMHFFESRVDLVGFLLNHDTVAKMLRLGYEQQDAIRQAWIAGPSAIPECRLILEALRDRKSRNAQERLALVVDCVDMFRLSSVSNTLDASQMSTLKRLVTQIEGPTALGYDAELQEELLLNTEQKKSIEGVAREEGQRLLELCVNAGWMQVAGLRDGESIDDREVEVRRCISTIEEIRMTQSRKILRMLSADQIGKWKTLVESSVPSEEVPLGFVILLYQARTLVEVSGE